MKNAKPILLFAALIATLLVFFISKREETPPTTAPPGIPERSPDQAQDPASPAPIGDQFLDAYADPNTTPLEDLRKIGRAIDSLLLLFKNLDTRHIATNGRLSAFLKGENPENTPHISPDHPLFGPTGELLDRWKQPIIVHPI
ncbi:MAG: hypothetical protein AAGB14_12030, partial [Verrucomicrobiota bacterium]